MNNSGHGITVGYAVLVGNPINNEGATFHINRPPAGTDPTNWNLNKCREMALYAEGRYLNQGYERVSTYPIARMGTEEYIITEAPTD